MRRCSAAKGEAAEGFDFDRLLATSAVCGSPAEVTERLSEAKQLLGLDLVALSMDLGGLPRDALVEAIELVGAEVVPALRNG